MSASATPSAKRPNGRPTLYQPHHSLAALRACADELGKPVAVADYRRWSARRSDVPSASTLVNQFGTWSAAASAVGFPRLFAPGRPQFYSRENTLNAIRGAAAELGSPLRMSHYQRWARDNACPSLRTISRQFGTWSQAASAAGVETVGQR